LDIEIRRVEITEIPFITLGHWFREKSGKLVILCVKLQRWQYEVAVILHELIEAVYCANKVITTEECDRFDAWWDEQVKAGVIPAAKEAGFDKRCPYHVGHIWGARAERFVIWFLAGPRINWKDYTKDCEEVTLKVERELTRPRSFDC
jgi:hypothetical protein